MIQPDFQIHKSPQLRAFFKQDLIWKFSALVQTFDPEVATFSLHQNPDCPKIPKLLKILS